jgi:hypothetical protein
VFPTFTLRLPNGPGPVAPKIKAGPPNRKTIKRPPIAKQTFRILRLIFFSARNRLWAEA